MKKSRGITLIALVITIIIMLILAGIILTGFSGEDNFFRKILWASDHYNQAAMNEADLINGFFDDTTYEDFPLNEPGRYAMTINGGGTVIWLSIELNGVTKPEGSIINIIFKTSDDRSKWDDEVDDILLTKDSRYLKVIVELIPNEVGECPSISGLNVKFKPIVTKEPIVKLENMVEDELGNFILTNDKLIGKVEQIIETDGEPIEEIELPILKNSNGTGYSSENSYGMGGNSNSGGNNVSTSFQGSMDGATWVPIQNGQNYNYIKSITTVSSLAQGASVGHLTVNPQKATSEKGAAPVKEEILSKSEEYVVDATEMGTWIKLEKDETLYPGTSIKYYFATSNDNETWSNFSENIGGTSRYLKMKVQYLKDSDSITKDAILNEWYIEYQVSDKAGGYIIKQSGNDQYQPEIIVYEEKLTSLDNTGFTEGYSNVGIKYSLKSSQRLYRIGTTSEWLTYTPGDRVIVPAGKTLYVKGINLAGEESQIGQYILNSCSSNSFDGSNATFDRGGTRTILVNQNVWNKQIHVYYEGVSGTYCYASINAILSDNSTVTIRGSSNSTNQNITIPENAIKIVFSMQENVVLYEISYVLDSAQYTPTISVTDLSPTTLANNGIVRGTLNMSYVYGSDILTSAYRIGENGEWKNYKQGDIIQVKAGEIVYIQGVDKYGDKTAIYSYTPLMEELGISHLVFDNNRSTGINGTNFVNVDPSMYNKNVHIYFYKTANFYSFGSVYAVDYEGNSTSLVSSRGSFDSVVTIPEGTVKLSFSLQQNVALYEVSIP